MPGRRASFSACPATRRRRADQLPGSASRLMQAQPVRPDARARTQEHERAREVHGAQHQHSYVVVPAGRRQLAQQRWPDEPARLRPAACVLLSGLACSERTKEEGAQTRCRTAWNLNECITERGRMPRRYPGSSIDRAGSPGRVRLQADPRTAPKMLIIAMVVARAVPCGGTNMAGQLHTGPAGRTPRG